jgi:6-phosphogluconolactonase/glucosamine-6-phosphate isomerase/deaminase
MGGEVADLSHHHDTADAEQCASVVFLVSGSEKAKIVKEVLGGPETYPAQAIKPAHGELLWMLDNDAAALAR